MEDPTRQRPGTARAGVWLTAVAAAALAVLAAVWSGCSVTPRNYRVLSFFFDGVPDPSAPAVPASRGGLGQPSLAIVHRPFAEENCEACHKTKFKPSRNDSSACMQCHPGVQGEHPRMHGPVAAGACLWCHAPHESSRPHLMRDSDRKVCAQCHTPALLDATRVPAHAQPARECLECHTGHGSTGPFMLRPGASADTPPPAPAEKR
jgi:predicted CXXCH cytochrome family protein